MDVIEIPDDLFNFEQPIEEEAYVYFEKNVGTIRGLSFVPDESLGMFDHIRIPKHTALSFAEGKADITEWVVEDLGNGYQMFHDSIHNRIKITLGEALPFQKIISNSNKGNIALLIKIDESGKHMSVNFHSTFKRSKIYCEEDVQLSLMITSKNSPEYIKKVANFTVAELVLKGVIVFQLPDDLGNEVDIYSVVYSGLNYIIEEHSVVRDIKDMPKCFDDMRVVEKIPEEMPPCLLFVRNGDVIDVKLHNGGGSIYARYVSELLVCFVEKNDPLRFHKLEVVDVNAMETNGVTINVPEDLDEFDICVPMVYNAAYYVEASDYRI